VRGPGDDFLLTLTKLEAARLRPKGFVVNTIGRHDTLPLLCQRLLENNVLSLPVLSLEGKFYGFVEQKDIVTFISNMFSEYEMVGLVDIQKAFQSEEKFIRATVGDIIQNPRRKRNPYYPLMRGVSLFTVWDTMVVEGLHRIPIIDPNGGLSDIITQSMLIDFLWQNLDKFDSDFFRSKTVQDIPDASEVVFTTTSSTRTIIAFRHMIAMEVQGLAVLNDSGQLVDNLSLRDLKRIHSDASMFWTLWNSVHRFKERMRKDAPQTTATRESEQGPICVQSGDTLYAVLEKLALAHVHRLYVVDSLASMKPIGVISQTDVLRYILRL